MSLVPYEFNKIQENLSGKINKQVKAKTPTPSNSKSTWLDELDFDKFSRTRFI